MAKNEVELGFLEDCESWQVESRLFPSKVGGKPAWLNLEYLPSAELLQCKKCLKTMIFLCQIYAPFEEVMQDSLDQYLKNFHRTLFVFVCRNPKCCVRNDCGNIKVFRSSLQRGNKFYSYDPPEEKPLPDFSLGKWVNLCNLCGCLSEKQCSKCKKVYYCSRDHQVFDWKEGHKTECGTSISHSNRKSKILFTQFEVITEVEELEERTSEENAELDKFKHMEAEGKTGTMPDVSEEELDANAVSTSDKVFSKFQERIEQNSDQVIRYKRGGTPLWISEKPLPNTIPNCEFCHGPRQFEFQIMPQMLTLLRENDIDWGVIVVYTCIASCTNGNDYKEEFVFKQDVRLDDVS